MPFQRQTVTCRAVRRPDQSSGATGAEGYHHQKSPTSPPLSMMIQMIRIVSHDQSKAQAGDVASTMPAPSAIPTSHFCSLDMALSPLLG